jgi:hypothetical protein
MVARTRLNITFYVLACLVIKCISVYIALLSAVYTDGIGGVYLRLAGTRHVQQTCVQCIANGHCPGTTFTQVFFPDLSLELAAFQASTGRTILKFRHFLMITFN